MKAGITFVTLTAISLAANVAATQAETESQDFASEAQATAAGWEGLRNQENGSYYGFSDTNYSGTASGEAGGTIARSLVGNYHADTTIGGPLSYDDPLVAEGTYYWTNPSSWDGGVIFGYFNIDGMDTSVKNLMGFQVNDPATPGLARVFPCSWGNTGGKAPNTTQSYWPQDTRIKWKFTYDPDADGGNGEMTLESWNVDAGMTPLDTVVKPLTEAVRANTATFNAFGITARDSTREALDHVADQYIDDLIYTVGSGESPLDGDLNSDGFVGGDDLDIVRSFWGQTVEQGNLLQGDPSNDGFVGGDDLDIVRANWGQGTPPAPSSVPEPSLPVFVLSGLLATMARRRRIHPLVA